MTKKYQQVDAPNVSIRTLARFLHRFNPLRVLADDRDAAAFSREFRRTKYRPANDAFGQKVIKLYQQLGDDAETGAGSPCGGYQSLDTQLPTAAARVADPRCDHECRVRALAGDM